MAQRETHTRALAQRAKETQVHVERIRAMLLSENPSIRKRWQLPFKPRTARSKCHQAGASHNPERHARHREL